MSKKYNSSPGGLKRLAVAGFTALGALGLGACGDANFQQAIGRAKQVTDVAERSGIRFEERELPRTESKMLERLFERYQTARLEGDIAADEALNDSTTGLSMVQNGGKFSVTIASIPDYAPTELVRHAPDNDSPENGEEQEEATWGLSATDLTSLGQETPYEVAMKDFEVLDYGVDMEEMHRRLHGITPTS